MHYHIVTSVLSLVCRVSDCLTEFPGKSSLPLILAAVRLGINY
jgi:hypothetical protein